MRVAMILFFFSFLFSVSGFANIVDGEKATICGRIYGEYVWTQFIYSNLYDFVQEEGYAYDHTSSVKLNVFQDNIDAIFNGMDPDSDRLLKAKGVFQVFKNEIIFHTFEIVEISESDMDGLEECGTTLDRSDFGLPSLNLSAQF